ncbi:hypothetical protein BTR23_04565 [Alkalihalophilus pseudofirmus]|nr:hypothetical protein BTR23_04565 [Alkalihalophilus pseudofirmus]
MEFRKLTKNDMDESLNLSEFAFQYKLFDEERTHRLRVTRPKDTIGCFSDGELIAKMTILPFQVRINGIDYEMGGVSGVATYPEHRRSGIVKKLLHIGLKEMKEKEQCLSYLFPFSIPFYRKFGWELFVDYQNLTLTREQLPHFQNFQGKMKKVDEKSLEVIQKVYDQYALTYTGMLKRNNDWWKDWVLYRKGGRIAVYNNSMGVPQGYIMYEVKDLKMTVKELIALDEDSRRGLWNFISNHDSMAEEYVIQQLPLHEPYPYWLDDPKIKKEVVPYFMARIVDVEAFLNRYPFKSKAECSLFLHVSDEFADWNEATYQIKFQNSGKVQVKKHEPKTKGVCQQKPKRGIICDINALSTMFLAYQSPTQLLHTERIKGSMDEVELLEQIIVKQPPGFIDFF